MFKENDFVVVMIVKKKKAKPKKPSESAPAQDSAMTGTFNTYTLVIW